MTSKRLSRKNRSEDPIGDKGIRQRQVFGGVVEVRSRKKSTDMIHAMRGE